MKKSKRGSVTKTKEKQIRMAFDIFDTDGSGTIDERELRAALKELGYNLSKQEVSTMFLSVDHDHSGSIEFEEFMQIIVNKLDDTAKSEGSEGSHASTRFQSNASSISPKKNILKSLAGRKKSNSNDTTQALNMHTASMFGHRSGRVSRKAIRKALKHRVHKTLIYTRDECHEISQDDIKLVFEICDEKRELWNIRSDEEFLLTSKTGGHFRRTSLAQNDIFSLPTKETFTKVIYPDAPRKQIWDVLMLFTIILSISTTIFYIGFDVEITTQLYTLNFILDFLFWIDILLNFRTAYDDNKGGFEIESTKIVKKYLLGWFAIDLISCFPIDHIAHAIHSVIESDLRSTRLLRILRLVRFLRILQYAKPLAAIEDLTKRYTWLRVHPGVFTFLRLVMVQFLFAHFAACIFYWIVTLSPEDTYTWADAYSDVRHSTLGHKYLTSLYWAFTTLATVGYGDVLPINDHERGYTILVIIIGAGYFGYTVGVVTEIFESIDVMGNLYAEKLQFVKEFIRSRHIPTELAKTLIEHYRYYYRLAAVLECDDLIRGLPVDQMIPLQKIQYGAIITQFGFLKATNPIFVTRLAALMKPFSLAGNDVLVCEGEIAQQMYFLRIGAIDLLTTVELPDDSDEGSHKTLIQVASIGDGNYFGECVLLNDEPLMYTAKASKFSELYYVNKQDLISLLEDWPLARTSLERIAIEFQHHVKHMKHAYIMQKTQDPMQSQIPFSASMESIYLEKELEAAEAYSHGRPSLLTAPSSLMPLLTEHEDFGDVKESADTETLNIQMLREEYNRQHSDASDVDGSSREVSHKTSLTDKSSLWETSLSKSIHDKERGEVSGVLVTDFDQSSQESSGKGSLKDILQTRIHASLSTGSMEGSGAVSKEASIPVSGKHHPVLRSSSMPEFAPETNHIEPAGSGREELKRRGSDAGPSSLNDVNIFLTDSHNNEEDRVSDLGANRVSSWIPTNSESDGKSSGVDLGDVFKKFDEMWLKHSDRLTLGEATPWQLWMGFRIIHPECVEKIVWDSFISALTVYSILLDTYEIAFTMNTSGAFLVMFWIVTAAFCLDILISFRTTFIDSEHSLVKNSQEITKNYLKGWFSIDLLSTIPFDEIIKAFVGKADEFGVIRYIKFLRILRVMKILRLKKVSEFMDRSSDVLLIPPALIRITKLILGMCFIAHIGGCIWVGIAVQEAEDYPGMTTWLDTYCVPYYEHVSTNGTSGYEVSITCANEASRISNYITSLYWALVTMTTTGYGDVKTSPLSEASTVFSVIMISLGVIVFAYIVSTIVGTIQNLSPASRNRRKNIDKMNSFLRELDVDTKFASALIDQIKFTLNFNGSMDQNEILTTLPAHLKTTVVYFLYLPHMGSLTLIRELEAKYPGFATIILPRLRPARYHEGEELFTMQLCPRQLSFVIHGKCQSIATGTGDVDTFRVGHWMGEEILFYPLEEILELTVTVRAMEYVETLTLLSDDWRELQVYYPTVMQDFQNILLTRRHVYNRKSWIKHH